MREKGAKTMASWSRPAGPGADRRLCLLLAALAALAGGHAALAAGPSLSLQDAWFRMVVPGRPAAGYFTLRNDGDTRATLVGAASPACGMASLHRSMESDGVVKMVPVEAIAVPAHGELRFAPGGYHVMCMQPAAAMAPGAAVSLTLRFADGTSLTAQVPVKSATGG
ncbi:hypothetical protein CSC94_16645 [Zhengella mangrovi]|uniref:Copper chaperone PCu(A)C n=1 Tax=Zhengella mangrovi TaxID=1982044 RepID=A0A2G1QK87_9HYPH|nr:hypothetical protein CSC94_16645 [Zhengella mangrovi]